MKLIEKLIGKSSYDSIFNTIVSTLQTALKENLTPQEAEQKALLELDSFLATIHGNGVPLIVTEIAKKELEKLISELKDNTSNKITNNVGNGLFSKENAQRASTVTGFLACLGVALTSYLPSLDHTSTPKWIIVILTWLAWFCRNPFGFIRKSK